LFGCTGDEEARARGTQKSILERKAPPTFPLVIEMRERACWVTHWVEDSVDCLLHGKDPIVQVRPTHTALHSHPPLQVGVHIDAIAKPLPPASPVDSAPPC